MKVITETVETTAEIDLTDEMKPFIIPTDFELPPGGLNLRWPDDRFEQDRRLQDYKGFAAIAFARANKVNRITMVSDLSGDQTGKVLGVSGPRGVREMRMMEMEGWKPPHSGWNAQDIVDHAKEIFFSEEQIKMGARRF